MCEIKNKTKQTKNNKQTNKKQDDHFPKGEV